MMDRAEMRRRSEEQHRQYLEGLPPELRPLAEEMFAARQEAVKVITAKNRAHAMGDIAQFERLEREAGEHRQRAYELESRLRDEVLEHEVASFPEEKQERARAIIIKRWAAAGGRFIGLELRHRKLVEAGDEAGAAALLPALQEAEKEMKAAREMGETDRQKPAEIAARYDAMLEELRRE